MFFGFFRFVLSGACCRLVKFVQKVEMDFHESVCVVLSLVSASGCLIGGQFGKTAGKFYPGGRKFFGSSFECFLGFSVSCCLGFVFVS